MNSVSGLQQRFARWCSAAGAPQPLQLAVWEALASHYGESHRHYHNLAHIGASLSLLDEVLSGEAAFAIEGAIWFHDVIYDPLAKYNEVASAALFSDLLGEVLDIALLEQIERLILATDFRTGPDGSADESVMVDIDLAILGAPRPDYDTYRKAIRREYSSVPDEAFRAGRAKVLRHFLERLIYLTPAFAGREAPARENLAWELALLEAGEPM